MFQPQRSRKKNIFLKALLLASLPILHQGGSSAYSTQPLPSTPIEQKVITVQKGDSLLKLLLENNISLRDANDAIRALKSFYDPRKMMPKDLLKILYHDMGNPKTFQGFTLLSRHSDGYRIQLNAAGTFTAKRISPNWGSGTHYYHGTFLDFKQETIPTKISHEILAVLKQRYQLNSDFLETDKWDVVLSDHDTSPKILRLSYQKQGSWKRIYSYRHAQKTDYYFETGESFRPSFLSTPLAKHYPISSPFGYRKHPILNKNILHSGTDFAAPKGTEVLATSDGVISEIYRHRTWGNHIVIDHGNGIETAYAHLNGFVSFLRKGSAVHKGDPIGYVGSTGASTGPHLHYEIRLKGKPVNPMTANVNRLPAFSAKDFTEFVKYQAVVDHYYKCQSGSFFNTPYLTRNDLRKTFNRFGWDPSFIAQKQCSFSSNATI